jgi:hypothetical protein
VIAVAWCDVVAAWRAAGGPPVSALGQTLDSEAAVAELAWRADPWQRGEILAALELPLLRSTALGAERLLNWEAAGRPTPDPARLGDIVYGDLGLAEAFVEAGRYAHPAVVDHALRTVQVFAAGGGSSLAWTGPSPAWRPLTIVLTGLTAPGKPTVFIAGHELAHSWGASIASDAEPGIRAPAAEAAAAIDAAVAKDPALRAATDRAEARADALARAWLTRP